MPKGRGLRRCLGHEAPALACRSHDDDSSRGSSPCTGIGYIFELAKELTTLLPVFMD